MGCYICKLLLQPTVCVTHETLFHFYYKWNQKKLSDPQYLSRILSLYAGKTESLLYELELKYGEFPMIYDKMLYEKYMQRRLFNVYAEHTLRLQNEGIDFIFALTKSFQGHLDVLLSKANSRYGDDTASILFPLETVSKADIPRSKREVENKESLGSSHAKRPLTVVTLPFVMSNDEESTSPYNESTIDIISSDDYVTNNPCEWDIVE